jgi:cell cycle sensor histidine kinase DivJ
MQARPKMTAEPVSAADLSQYGPDCYSLHSADGAALLVNGNSARLFGAEPHEMLGDAFFDIIRDTDVAEVRQAIAACAQSGRERRVTFRASAKSSHQRMSGALAWFELHCVPCAGTGHSSGPLVLAISRDVTERIRLERQLQDARDAAESTNIAKTRFLANMSHELRTPLNAIIGFAELLQTDLVVPLTPEKQREYVSLIHNSASHLLNILNDILDMSKIDAGKYEIFPEPFDLGNTVRACAAIMNGQARKKGIEIHCLDMDVPEINADERAIKQILMNLLSNAVKFTEPGGRVEIGAERAGNQVRLRISDTGIGISAEHLASLGVPFYQADSKYDRKYEGTGLGLSVVFGLVQLHRGKVHFSSRRNAGTTVTVTLPLDAKRTRRSDAVTSIASATPAAAQSNMAAGT